MMSVLTTRRAAFGGIAVGVPLILLLLAWPVAAAWARAQVHVILAPNALTCQGADVSVGPLEPDDEDSAFLMADATPGMRCELRVRVENRGPRAVVLHRLETAFLGPRTGFPARATGLSGYAVPPREGERDAIFDLPPDVRVEAHDVLLLSVQVEFNPKGCGTKGGTVSVPDQPRVALSALGLPGTRHVFGSGYGFLHTQTLRCPPS